MLHIVVKGNRERRVREDQLEPLLADGWTEYDPRTKNPVVRSAAPEPIAEALARQLEAVQAENARLTEERDALAAQVATYENTIRQLSAPEPETQTAPEEQPEPEEQPAKAKSKSK
jgi:hypothetical protein